MYYIDSNASMVRVRNMDLYLLDANKCFKLGIFKKSFGVVAIYHYSAWLWVLVYAQKHIYSVIQFHLKVVFFCTCDSIALNMVLNLLKTVILYLVYIELNHHVIMSISKLICSSPSLTLQMQRITTFQKIIKVGI